MRRVSRWFWGTILSLVAIVLGLVALALWHGPDLAHLRPPPRVEISETRLEDLVASAADEARARATETLEGRLDTVFAPVHAAIPAYAEFHYSVMGEYIELGEAATGRISASLQDRLFDGFDARLETAVTGIDDVWNAAFATALKDGVERERRGHGPRALLDDATRIAVEDTVDRATAAKPVQAVLLTGGAALGKKAVLTPLSKALGKQSAKLAAKAVAKSTGIGASAAGGAAAGSLLGPVGAAAGGVLAGLAAWLAMDAIVVNVDELLTRDAFEAELRQMIDDRRAVLHADIEASLAARSSDLAGTTLRDRIRNEKDRPEGAASSDGPKGMLNR